ncbi:MAG: cation transporter [Deltaproteobacteria bacterium]|nr:cation transporter [Deltaproteobacteria bacterium]
MGIDHAARRRAAWISLVVGAAIFVGKIVTWQLTGSVAVLSDALESTVNIAAAALLVFSMFVAARPADRDHPYGHGKVEFLSAGIEGALIVVAAVLIAVEAIGQLIRGGAPHDLNLALVMLAALSAGNALLGFYLLRTGRAAQSLALIADGKHVLADVWTSAGVLVGLAAVKLTGIVWLDPAVALAVAANIVREGFRLARSAVRGLMDEADPELLNRLVATLARERAPHEIDVHGLRAWRSGALVHADLHLVVPRYYDAERLHEVSEEVEERLLAGLAEPGEAVVHFDPCGPVHCASCEVPACRVRGAAFKERAPLSVLHATRTDPDADHAKRAARH